jgi:hypothetical protein
MAWRGRGGERIVHEAEVECVTGASGTGIGRDGRGRRLSEDGPSGAEAAGGEKEQRTNCTLGSAHEAMLSEGREKVSET